MATTERPTRDRLLAAAHDLFYERRSTSASVAEICERAGTNVAMVKYWFGSKDGLLDALLEEITAGFAPDLEQLDALDLGPEETLRHHVAGVVGNYVRYPYVNRLLNERLMQAGPDAAARLAAVFAKPTRDWYARLIESGVRAGVFRELEPTFLFFSVMGACEFIFTATPWLEHGFGAALDEAYVDRFAAHTAALVLDGVRAGGG